MQLPDPIVLSDFFVAGINYKKTDASVRGEFSINNEQYEKLVSLAPSFGIKEFLVISTCNRTEIYGFATDKYDLCRLLMTQTIGTIESFLSMAYIRQGKMPSNIYTMLLQVSIHRYWVITKLWAR